MNEMFSIDGKVAVITGAAGVLGGSIARHFASQGARIAALVHRSEQVQKCSAELKELGVKRLNGAVILDGEGLARRIVERRSSVSDFAHYYTLDL